MLYSNESLNKRISELTNVIYNTFKDKDRVMEYIERDLKEGSNLIQTLSDNLKKIADENKKIHLIYNQMKEENDKIINIDLEKISNLTEQKKD